MNLSHLETISPAVNGAGAWVMVCGVRGAVQRPAECNLTNSPASSKVASETLELGPDAGSSAMCPDTVWRHLGSTCSLLGQGECPHVQALNTRAKAWLKNECVKPSTSHILPPRDLAVCRGHLQHGIDDCRSTSCVVEPHPGPHTTYRCGRLEKLPTAGVEFFLASEQLARSPRACAHRACTLVPAD